MYFTGYLHVFLYCCVVARHVSLCKIKSRIAKEKAAFNKKRVLFNTKMDLELRKKLVKCYIWSIALYGADTWTPRGVDQNTWKVLKCGAGEGWSSSVGPIM
jgi:hypothetical protein